MTKEKLKPIDTSKYKITDTGQVLKTIKDEMKDRISMALKDPVLQQGFEIICKNLAELKEENKFLKEQCLILADGNVCSSTCSEIKKQLSKAKELIRDLLQVLPKENIEGVYEITEEAEQFLNSKEVQ